MTGLTLYALSVVPADWRDALREAARDAGRFLIKGIDRRGAVACPDGSFDYPVYATAQVLIAAKPLPVDLGDARLAKLREYLLAAQLLAPQGFRPDDKHYGGWDLVGAAPGTRSSTGSNISYVRFAVEGLAAAGVFEGVKESSDSPTPPERARRAALAWLDRCQRPTGDGGFVFSPDPGSLDNKALWRDETRQQPRSYGSPSCDGLRALVACGVAGDSASRRSAAKWLDEHWSPVDIPGLPTDDDGRLWNAGMRFYHAEALSGALPHFSTPQLLLERQTALARALVGDQRGDGSWRSASSRMREDDPLIATALAVAALGRCWDESQK